MVERGPAIGMDATPTTSGHAERGIGRYVGGLLAALSDEAPEWATSHVGTLLAGHQAAPLAGVAWRTHRAPIRPQDLDVFIAAISDRLAIRRRRPGLWHHTDPNVPVSPMGAGKTIATVYDLIPLSQPEVWAGLRPHRRLLYRRYLALVRAARGVIAISSSTADEVSARLGVPVDRIRVVLPYVQAVGRRVDPDAALDPSHVDPTDALEARRFLFVGVLEPHKRADLAIATIAELARRGEPATLSIVGSRPASRRALLEAQARRLGVADRITFVGRPDDASLGRLYATSTLLATSTTEGFGLPPVEAILAGGRVAAVPSDVYREILTGVASFSADSSVGAFADSALVAADSKPDRSSRVALAERFGATAATDSLRAAYAAFGAA